MARSLCPILLLDGGLGTTLESPPYNISFSSSTPLWSSHLLRESPAFLLSVQKEFVQAGSDVLLTATYQASYEGFAATPCDKSQLTTDVPSSSREAAIGHMRHAVSIAREAFKSVHLPSSKSQLVALSLGAYGACMVPSQEYSGNYSPAALCTVEGLSTWHRDRLEAFTSSPETWNEIDLVAFETIPIRNEIYAARRVMTELARTGQEKPWYISCVFPNANMELPDGSSVSEIVSAMIGNERGDGLARPWGVGVNCTKTERLPALIEAFEAAIKSTPSATARGRWNSGKGEWWSGDESCNSWPWLVVYPDGTENESYNTTTQAWEASNSKKIKEDVSWAEEILEIVNHTREKGKWSGVLLGGCCKTSPNDIKELKRRTERIRWDKSCCTGPYSEKIL
ncbi:hypothetical protein MMC13_002335 [Lambiella insularis]|nr:hypothetical protein [Lambiella insularis]